MHLDIKHVCFDLNKTLISENTWLESNQAMGMTLEEDQRLCDLYEAGDLSYINWQKKIEKIYIEKGKATKENIKKVIFQYTYNPNAREMVKYLRERGYILSLVSGSVDLLVKKVANELKISYFFSNNAFVFDADNYLSAIKCFGDDIKTKTIQLKRLCDELKIDITETACIGDGDNDWEIFKVSQHGISFKGSKNKKYIWKEIGTLSDIKQIL